MKIECPGFCDLQVNGFAGVDFNHPGLRSEDLDRAVDALRVTGVTRFLPTLITSSFEDFALCARVLSRWNHYAAVGIHMEGPYISPTVARGTHPADHIAQASVDDFLRRQEAAEGRIILVTLAPEVPGALSLVEYLVEHGIRVAIGHSNASPEEIRRAVAAGATLSTHLGNGCAATLVRHPNLIWEQLAADSLKASFIADGHHLPAATLKSMVRAKTTRRAILVTDATAAAAMPAGRYTLGQQEIERNAQGRVTRPGTSDLAGSALTLDHAVAGTVRDTGLTLEEVLPMASTHPATYLGLAPAGVVSADWDPECFSFNVRRVDGA